MATILGEDGETEYAVTRFEYTTAEIEANTFYGETPNPAYFAMPEPPVEFVPVTLAVIDGELRAIRDEAPPGAHLPNHDSWLLRHVAHQRVIITSPPF